MHRYPYLTIDGRFRETLDGGDGNHRTYYTTTQDFKTFAPTKLFFDPGFNCIDTTMIKAGGKYHLIFKDERSKPVSRKDLRSAVGDSATGPWREISEAFSRKGVEGPSVLKMGDEYVVYFDGFAGGGYPNTAMVTSSDLGPKNHPDNKYGYGHAPRVLHWVWSMAESLRFTDQSTSRTRSKATRYG